jgi:hypothetical protein
MSITRIASAASNAQLVNILLDSQSRLNDLEVQVSSQEVSQDYTGIATQSERLLGLENKRDLLQSFNNNNDTMQVRLSTQLNTITTLQDTIKAFQKDLNDYAQNTSITQSDVDLIQQSAYRGMKAMEAYLNTDVDGSYLFSGTRFASPPVNIQNSDSLSSFQAAYDGSTITWPTTRNSTLHPKLTATTGLPTNPTGAGFTNVTFVNPGTLTAATAGSFANLPVGSSITISGSTLPANDGTYTITANTGTTLTLSGAAFAASANDAAPTITANTSWYQGDENAIVHRVDENQRFTNAVNAIDPSFEKAIRAMGLIAQGAFGTAGGLDQNTQRVDQAKYLLQASLFSSTQGVPPFGAEQAGSMQDVQNKLGYNQVLIKRANDVNTETISLLDGRVGKLTQTDMLSAITQVTNGSRALEAAYQTIARIRSLSLQDFLK